MIHWAFLIIGWFRTVKSTLPEFVGQTPMPLPSGIKRTLPYAALLQYRRQEVIGLECFSTRC